MEIHINKFLKLFLHFISTRVKIYQNKIYSLRGICMSILYSYVLTYKKNIFRQLFKQNLYHDQKDNFANFCHKKVSKVSPMIIITKTGLGKLFF